MATSQNTTHSNVHPLPGAIPHFGALESLNSVTVESERTRELRMLDAAIQLLMLMTENDGYANAAEGLVELISPAREALYSLQHSQRQRLKEAQQQQEAGL